MDKTVKRRIQELAEAINESVSASEHVGEVIAGIRAEGYDTILAFGVVLAARRPAGQQASPPNRAHGAPVAKFNRQDRKFLESLHIVLDK